MTSAITDDETMEQKVTSAALTVRNLSVFFGANEVLKKVSLDIVPRAVTAIIGPSGCGKSTFLRALNRMHELNPEARMTGEIRLFGEDIYARTVEPVIVRRRVGMVFQKSNPFPTMTISENVTVGLRLNGVRDKKILAERTEQSLRMAALWDEVKDRLNAAAISLSGGQQQRLCIARALAVQPEVLLMDEPASALDPLAGVENRGLDFGIEKELHHRHRDSQHAAGRARVRFHRRFLSWRTRRDSALRQKFLPAHPKSARRTT